MKKLNKEGGMSSGAKRVAASAAKGARLVTKPFRKKPRLAPGRITTETIAEHREQVLAGGRRFKYPIQYARHRLVFNTIIIVVAALILLLVVGWWQLYRTQNSSEFMYRVTRVMPVPVASVDGKTVSYADYLMRYRSSIHYKEEKEQVNFNTPEGKVQIAHIKREEMDSAIADAYASKLAVEKNITVTDVDLQAFLKKQRGDVSQTTYNAVILDYYGWSADEYAQITRAKLLHQRVAYAVDTQATASVNTVLNMAKSGQTDLKTIADAINATAKSKVLFASSGIVPKDNQDGGLAAAATALDQGGISAAIRPTNGNGYYIVKKTGGDASNVSYEYIHIPLTMFVAQLEALHKDGKIKELISIPEEDVAPAAATEQTK